jgi:hypothetical protein
MPYNGNGASHKTEVRVVYDNTALYIGAVMYDPHPDSIYTELGERDADRMLNADYFSVEICPYNDGINGFEFKVSASGVQTDKRVEANEFGRRGGGGSGGGGGGMGSQDNWDAVWDSEFKITDQGWVVEMRIPYSALRFPKNVLQTWGINFWREVRRTREMTSWNFVNRDIGSTINQLGELINITDTKPPVRLSLSPYLSGYVQKVSDTKGTDLFYNGGLDLKYGINESFTLDMTLVPDFGQVQSDDQVLNLTPYEVRYNEKRPFFTEGTELFNKGDIFYSRRIGSQPKGYENVSENLDSNEIVLSNPSESELINATKFSGRTTSGLGIGVFNGMTKPMYATIRDTLSGSERFVNTGPFTNYNMIVLDQNLKNNSYISFENTNVYRDAPKDENYYTANVTATDFNIQSKSRLYSIAGKGAISQKYYDTLDSEFGHYFDLRGGKTGGVFRAEYRLNAISDTYDPNDMGYLRRNNEFENAVDLSYNVTKPFWRILSSRNSLRYQYNMLYNPKVFVGSSAEISSFTTFKNYLSLNVRFEANPQGIDDYYEPRVSGHYYHRGADYNTLLWISSNRNKRFYYNIMGNRTKIISDYDQSEFMISASPSLRISNSFSFSYSLVYNRGVNDIGYVADNPETNEIFFGMRNNKTVTNTFTSGYIFTAKSYLSFRLRHYWSEADYNDNYYLLNEDGSLTPTDYSGNFDTNFNSFNIDMVYTWRFAPGSDLTVVWKNSIYSSGSVIFDNYQDNLKNMFDSQKTNSISLKLLYYFDYQYLKKK